MAGNLFPVQGGGKLGKGQGRICEEVYMRAYEVYCHIYAPQRALLEGNCRGGFGKCELIGFLYASGFPKEQWKARVDEAFAGMNV